MNSRLAPFHLTFGVDPGASGAIAVLHDGIPIAFHDMPTKLRKAGSTMVDAGKLATIFRTHRREASGAVCILALEQVGAIRRGDRQQGGTSMFNFGQADGIVRGVVGSLGLNLVTTQPQAWKKRYGLIKSEKDASRSLALERFPLVRHYLARKKDCGRADALFIALHAYETEQRGVAP